MMTSIKFRVITGTLLILLSVLCYGAFSQRSTGHLELQTFETGNGGWGYNILMNNKVKISQAIVPAIDSVMPFPSEESAGRVGQIVLERILNKENFSVSRQEVEYYLSY